MSVYVCVVVYLFFFFKQKTAYELRISDWSSDVCSSDLFLNLDDLLLFPGLVLLLLGLVAETAVVENLANRWLGVGRNLHEVQSGTLRPAPGIGGRYDADLLSVLFDQADLGGGYYLVHARPVAGGSSETRREVQEGGQRGGYQE